MSNQPAQIDGLYEPLDERQLIDYLEPDQLAAETMRPVPRATLGPRALAALWVLRVFVVIVSAMVVYTFVARLH